MGWGLGATSEECLSFPAWELMVAMTEIDREKSERDGAVDERMLYFGKTDSSRQVTVLSLFLPLSH